nr:hypothetical protein [Tanacetum cinerariifolium]
EKSSSKAFTLSSHLNKEPKVGRFYREVRGAIVGVKASVCCIGWMKGIGGGGIVVTDGGISSLVVTRTSTREVDLMFKLRMESIPASGIGLSMLEIKPDDTEELCC